MWTRYARGRVQFVGAFSESVFVGQYYDINTVSIDQIQHERTSSGEIVPVGMTITSFAAGLEVFNPSIPYDSSLVRQDFQLDRKSLGPFDRDGPDLKSLVNTFRYVVVSFEVESFDLRAQGRTCFKWLVQVGRDEIALPPSS